MKNKNEMCQKLVITDGIIVPAAVTASIVGCSISAVKKVRNGFIGKTGKGKKCQAIIMADSLLKDAITLGIEHVNDFIKCNYNMVLKEDVKHLESSSIDDVFNFEKVQDALSSHGSGKAKPTERILNNLYKKYNK